MVRSLATLPKAGSLGFSTSRLTGTTEGQDETDGEAAEAGEVRGVDGTIPRRSGGGSHSQAEPARRVSEASAAAAAGHVKVGELIAQLEMLRRKHGSDTEVVVEGCDCTRRAIDARFEGGEIHEVPGPFIAIATIDIHLP